MKELSIKEEDEKIRQFLLSEVTGTSDEIMSYRNMNKKDVIAWLEKQGEKKPEWTPEDEMMIKFALTHFRMVGATEDGPIIKWLKSIKSRI